MKISNLTIKNYKQFKDLTLDLTYPKGHDKEGQPLDKICIIGQSGTGKTNLLDIIKKSTVDFSKNSSYKPFNEFLGQKTDDKYIINSFLSNLNVNVNVLFTEDGSKIEFTSEEELLKENEKIYSVSADKKTYKLELENTEIKKTEVNDVDKTMLSELSKYKEVLKSQGISTYGIDNFHKKLNEVDIRIKNIKNKYSNKNSLVSDVVKNIEYNNFIKSSIIDINEQDSYSWELLKTKIDNYQMLRTQYNETLSNKLLNDDSYSKEDYKSDFSKWESENENILDKISSDINKILNKFNLELTKIDENQKSYNSLTVKDLSNKTIIEYDDLSTGTKNLLSTFIPLKSFSPKDSIILIDEPEMSFYPDIQKKLVDLYTNVGENNQLVLATHSPIIASGFEPWEIVELKFDEDNYQIKREKYFEGEENHVDNYTLDPRMLTWTGILTDIFDLKEDSNFTIREEALMQYATLKSEIKMIDDIEEKERKFKELQKLSKKLGLEN